MERVTIRCRCIKKIKNQRGYIERYILSDGQQCASFSSQDLKSLIANKSLLVDNLKFDSKGRLIDCKPAKLPAKHPEKHVEVKAPTPIKEVKSADTESNTATKKSEPEKKQTATDLVHDRTKKLILYAVKNGYIDLDFSKVPVTIGIPTEIESEFGWRLGKLAYDYGLDHNFDAEVLAKSLPEMNRNTSYFWAVTENRMLILSHDIDIVKDWISKHSNVSATNVQEVK